MYLTLGTKGVLFNLCDKGNDGVFLLQIVEKYLFINMMNCGLLRAKVIVPNDIGFFCSIVHSGHSYVKSAISFNPCLEYKLLLNLLRISKDS
jgi:hypothetical protein